MHLLFVQPLLPSYSISFFNSIASQSGVKLTVIADIKTSKQLNQYRPEICNFDVIHLPEKNYKGFIFRPRLLHLIKSVDFDKLILNSNPRDMSQLFSLVYWRVLGRPAYTWGMFHRIGKRRLSSELYFYLAARLSKKCLTYSRRGLLAQLSRGASLSKLSEIGTAIDENKVIEERQNITKDELALFVDENNIANRKIILQVVRLSKIKKPELLIQASRKIIESEPSALFVLIGGGDLENQLKSMVSDLGLNGYFIFAGPIYDENILAKWFLSSKVFVIPTCIGLSAHHAMCYSLPIVTDNDPLQQASEFEILSDGVNSLLYDYGDVDSLSNSIAKLLGDEEYSKRIGENAFFTVINTHNLNNKVNRLMRAINDEK